MSKSSKKPLSLAVGAALATTLAAAPLTGASAAENPFGMERLSSGYMVAGAEGKCGGEKAKSAEEGKCGGEMAKEAKEGKCGAGKCGGEKTMEKESAPAEGKCGAGKCGASK
jgi:uncharacterized low-complexity protein